MFKLCVITDEISQDLEHACKVGKEYGISAVELRAVWGKGPKDFTNAEVKKMKALLDENELACACVASPFFKCELDSPSQSSHLDILKRSIEIADMLAAPIIRAFTFWKRASAQEKWNYILDAYRRAVEIVADTPFSLGVENEHSTYIATGAELGRFLGDLNSPKVKGVWDPGNSFFDVESKEKPYPDGYEACKQHLIHFHLKDAMIDPASGKPRFVAVGEGAIDYPGQFKALVRDNYTRYVSLETHFRIETPAAGRPPGAAARPTASPAELASRKCFQNLLKMIEGL